MPQISVMFPIQRHPDPAKVAEIVAAAGVDPDKPAGFIYKSDEGHAISTFALLKFTSASARGAARIAAALKPFGEVRIA